MIPVQYRDPETEEILERRLRGVRPNHRDAGADRFRALPGALPLAVCADQLHSLRAAGAAGSWRSRRRLEGGVFGAPSFGYDGLLEYPL